MTDAAPAATKPAAPTSIDPIEFEKVKTQLAALAQALADADEAKALAEERAAVAEQRAVEAEAAAAAHADAAASAQARVSALVGIANASQASSKERYRIIISDPRDAQDIQRVYVGVNGRGYDLARGVEVDVPMDVIEVLKNAVVGVTAPRVDETTGLPNGYSVRNAMRFPFQMIGKVVDDKGNALENPVPVRV